jgi:poly-gamma-glutamate synthesis protein (capsule biosynthesis protein)
MDNRLIILCRGTPWCALFVILLSLFILIFPAFAIDTHDTVILKNKKPDITINFLGDIILGRTVAMREESKGVNYPFLKTASVTANASLTVANLETPLSDKYPPVYKNTMEFIAPSKSVKGLTYAGIDLVALANNHSTNYGEGAFKDTLKTLSEARALRIIEINGVSFGFLNYNSIRGSINAADNSAGVAFVRLKPSYTKDNEDDIDRMLQDIYYARSKCDVLVIIMHWGVEYQNVTPTQVRLAHAFIDNGVDIVIGTHPHIAQPVELYKGKLIAYSLGNFVFDQMWADDTREGYMLQVYLSGKELTGFKVMPYKIYDYAQPRWEDNPALLQKVMPK